MVIGNTIFLLMKMISKDIEFGIGFLFTMKSYNQILSLLISFSFNKNILYATLNGLKSIMIGGHE